MFLVMHTAINSTEHSWTFTVAKIVSRSPFSSKISNTNISQDRELYKTRLQVFFKEYPSKNFDGRPWSTLNEVILVSFYVLDLIF